MILVIFLILLAIFVIVPVIGYAVWTMITIALTGIALGILARLIIPGRQPIGLIPTILSGWFGSIFGGLIGLGLWGRHGHGFPRTLIDIGVAALAVLVFHGATRYERAHAAKEASKVHQGHRVIDV